MPQKYGYQANGAVAEHTPCVVCDAERPVYSWTDAHGEGYCTRCGTPYQLLDNGQRIPPRCNVKPEGIPILREFWAERQTTNGLGTFVIAYDYPDQIAGRKRFNEWYEAREAATTP